MHHWSHNAVYVSYAITCVVLCCNLLILWAYSGAMRNRVKSTPNAEDVALFGGALTEIESPEIARVLRAHANAQASIYPFLALGLVYVLAAGPAAAAIAYFATFCIARIVHSFAYVAGLQPWRTVSFAVGGLTTFILMAHVLWLVLIAA